MEILEKELGIPTLTLKGMLVSFKIITNIILIKDYHGIPYKNYISKSQVNVTRREELKSATV